MSTINVEILSGLPGSGKTYYAENEYEKFILGEKYFSREELKVVSLDEPAFLRHDWFHNFRKRVIIDGLILTNQQIIDIIEEAKKQKYGRMKLTFTVIRWKEDREKCLLNDKGRRAISSANTIKCAKFEYPDKELIKKKTGYDITIIEKDIVEKSKEYNVLSKNIQDMIHGDYLISDSWIISGRVRSYDANWDSVYQDMIPEEQPEFTALIDYISQVYPKISFSKGIEAVKRFSKIREYREDDYYSDSLNGQYVCNLKELNDFLTDKNVTNGENISE